MTFVTVICANALTIMFMAGVWRLNRNDGDLRAYGMVIFPCVFALIAAIGAASEMEKPAPTYRSVTELADPNAP